MMQASWGSRYMGKLVLKFKPSQNGGRVSQIDNEIFMLGGPSSDEHVPEDEEALQLIKSWRKF